MSDENWSLPHEKFKQVTTHPIELDALDIGVSICSFGLDGKEVV